jgi:hypothetical protein
MTCTSPEDLVGWNCVRHNEQYIKIKSHTKNTGMSCPLEYSQIQHIKQFGSFQLLYLAHKPSYWKTVESELLCHLKRLIENPKIPCPPDFQCQHDEHILKANGWELISGEPSDINSLKKKMGCILSFAKSCKDPQATLLHFQPFWLEHVPRGQCWSDYLESRCVGIVLEICRG